MVKSILCNLLDNAIKYSPKGSTICVAADAASDKSLTFSVANACPPVTNEQMAMLFKPFYRIPGSTAQGTGLGLTIAQKQARMGKGKITAEKTPGGIVFKVSLPGS